MTSWIVRELSICTDNRKALIYDQIALIKKMTELTKWKEKLSHVQSAAISWAMKVLACCWMPGYLTFAAKELFCSLFCDCAWLTQKFSSSLWPMSVLTEQTDNTGAKNCRQLLNRSQLIWSVNWMFIVQRNNHAKNFRRLPDIIKQKSFRKSWQKRCFLYQVTYFW